MYPYGCNRIYSPQKNCAFSSECSTYIVYNFLCIFRRYGSCCQQHSQPHKKSYLFKMESKYTTENLFHWISGCIHILYHSKHMGRLASIFSSHRLNYYSQFEKRPSNQAWLHRKYSLLWYI